MNKVSESTPFAVRVQSTRSRVALRLWELWAYRELLMIFVWRDLKVRYRQTVVGALWAIIQPLLTMLIFSVFIGRLAGVPSDGVPYPIFSYVALVPWTFVANSVTQASNSLVNSAEMIKKIYFPRLVLPFSSVLAGLLDLALAFLLLIVMMYYYGFAPTRNIIWLPFFVLIMLMTASGISLWFSALNVQFRDVRYVLPFVTQAWLWATPVAYPSSLLSEPWKTLYGINPMAGVVEGFRWALLGTHTNLQPMLIVSFVVAFGIFLGGMFFFRTTERIFADII